MSEQINELVTALAKAQAEMLQTDQARVKEFLLYDPETGVFTWKKRQGRFKTSLVGHIAGCPRSDGYWRIRLDDQLFAAHRLAWLYVYGVLPPAQIDHINGDRTDNRIANLRLATNAENGRNSRGKPSVSGLKGAHLIRSRQARGLRPWAGTIMKNRKTFHLGFFATAEEAHAAYGRAATELHGDFARTA